MTHAADPLHTDVQTIVPSDVSWRCSPSPHRARCRHVFAVRVAQPPGLRSNVQASYPERGRPMAVAAFAGGLAAGSAAPPGRRRRERERGAQAEGKIKGRGTWVPAKPVCTWGWRGTRRWVAPCRRGAQGRVNAGFAACFVRWAAMAPDRSPA